MRFISLGSIGRVAAGRNEMKGQLRMDIAVGRITRSVTTIEAVRRNGVGISENAATSAIYGAEEDTNVPWSGTGVPCQRV